MVENHNRIAGITEEIKEKPTNKYDQKGYHRDWLINQTEEEYEEDNHGVIHPEVVEVSFDSTGGVVVA